VVTDIIWLFKLNQKTREKDVKNSSSYTLILLVFLKISSHTKDIWNVFSLEEVNFCVNSFSFLSSFVNACI